MRMKDAKKYVNRLTLSELKHFAIVGLVFEVNMYDVDDAERTLTMLKKRPPKMKSMLTRHGMKPVGYREG